MILPPTVRVCVATEPVDMRKGFDGLACVVRQVLAEDLLSGHLVVFFNRRADVTKLLFWTISGFTIVHKRLEKGRFSLLRRPSEGARRIEMAATERMRLLEGIDLRGARHRQRWERAAWRLDRSVAEAFRFPCVGHAGSAQTRLACGLNRNLPPTSNPFAKR